MRVKTLELRNFTVHECLMLDLPEKGIVLITGDNGSGKSSIVEAVSTAAWGASLRGKSGWVDDKKGQILLTTYDGLSIDRRKSSKTSLQFSLNDHSDKYDTASKAQEALDKAVGSHEVWKRSCAFSSRDSSNFTEASDGDRKRFIESVLGLERLDVASGVARADLRTAREALLTASHEYTRAQDLAAFSAATIDATRVSLKSLEHVAFSDAAFRQAHKSTLAVIERLEQTVPILKAKTKEITILEHQVETMRQQVRSLQAMDECPTCTQEVPEHHKDQTELHVHGQCTILESRITPLKQEIDLLEKERKCLSWEGARASKEFARQQGLKNESDRLASEISRLKRVERLELIKLSGAHDAGDEASVKVHNQTHEVALLEAVERVLSTKGVRAHLLHNALTYIEETANEWLARVAGDLSLKLTPYTEKSTGGLKDSIGLEIQGAGGGHGYKAASGGERRRIDLALMLALGEIAEASAAVDRSTLFFDEVLDALDSQGVQSVVEVVQELATTRCVVVISHNADVMQGLSNVVSHVAL